MLLQCPTLGWHKPGFVNLYPISLWASTNLWVRTGPEIPTVQLSHLGPKWCDQLYGHTRLIFRPTKHNPRCFNRDGFGQKKIDVKPAGSKFHTACYLEYRVCGARTIHHPTPKALWHLKKSLVNPDKTNLMLYLS